VAQVLLRTLDRFSPFAYASIALFIVSGGFNAKVHIPSWYAYFHSVYGITLTVKIALVGLMMLVSAHSVFRLRPVITARMVSSGTADRDAMMGLLRWLRVNPGLGAAVLLATSVLFYYPVPVGLAPAGPSSYSVHTSGLVAEVRLLPDRAGENQVRVTLRRVTGKFVRQAHVTILTTMLDMEMGTGLAPMRETSPGHFAGSTDLGMGGHWQLQLLVYLPPGKLLRLPVKVEVGS
jgi:copper transport protein